MTHRPLCAALACALACACAAAAAGPMLVVGSKRFTESYLLGEIVVRSAGPGAAVHRQGLGSTAILFEALKSGAIDAYPEYLGTIDREILGHPGTLDAARRREELAARGLEAGVPFGFQNGYALAMRAGTAARLSVASIGDLAGHPGLRLGLSHEFVGRRDGWPGLARRYGLAFAPVGIEHSLAYTALAEGRIDVTDVYSTDPRIASSGLTVLADDRAYFPRYDALLLYRSDVPRRFPDAWRRIRGLEGRIDAPRMIAMNAQAEMEGRAFAEVAASFVEARLHGTDSSAAAGGGAAPGGAIVRPGFVERLVGDDLGRLAREHVGLSLAATALAVAVGIPVGAWAVAWPRLGHALVPAVGALQTVPSLAMFALLIPLLGTIGTPPALTALALYALLPVMRNTVAGLRQVPPGLRDAGDALGLTRAQRWRCVDLPLAAPVILAGVKTAAVISIGTATIAAFVGAGGFGERIATGLALNDNALLLAGAVPAAGVALATQGAFEIVEWLWGRRRGIVTPGRDARGRRRTTG